MSSTKTERHALTPTKADALWRELRDALTAAHDAIRRIVETRAWEPLGYATFSDAWNERMAGVPLATTEAKAWVVYTMLDEGRTVSDISAKVAGVAERTASLLREQHAAGVSPEYATARKPSFAKPENGTVVREHIRRLPSEARRLHCTPSTRDYLRFTDIAKREGFSNEQALLRAVQIVVDRNGFE